MHGKAAKLWYRSGGVLHDISPYLTKTGLVRKADTAETSTLGTNDKQYLNGMRDATLSLDGFFDPVADGWFSSEVGGTAEAFRYFPQGSATGKIYYSGSAILTDYEVHTDTSGAGGLTGSLTVTGPVTRTVAP